MTTEKDRARSVMHMVARSYFKGTPVEGHSMLISRIIDEELDKATTLLRRGLNMKSPEVVTWLDGVMGRVQGEILAIEQRNFEARGDG